MKHGDEIVIGDVRFICDANLREGEWLMVSSAEWQRWREEAAKRADSIVVVTDVNHSTGTITVRAESKP